MIDIHSHLLAGIDDGSQSIQDSLILAQYAADNGITHAVITPHIHHGRYDNNFDTINTAFNELQQVLIEEQVSLKIAFAAEVRVGFEIIGMIEQNQIPFLGEDEKYRYLLLEMPHSHVLPGVENLIELLLEQNIIPVIAHPERNKELQKNPKKAEIFKKIGCLFQLTAASVSGKFGDACFLTAKNFLQKGWVDIVATDAHNIQHRPPDLRQSRVPLEELVGQKEADNLLIFNPWKIVQNKFN